MHFLSLDSQEKAPPTNISKYPYVDLLELMSLTMFTFVYPSNTFWLLQNLKPTLELPLRYRKIHFTSSY